MSDKDFDDVVAVHSSRLMRVAFLLCRDFNRSEDLVQEAFLRALRQWRRTGLPEHPGSYLRQVVVNEYLGWLRRLSSREITVDDTRIDSAVPDGADERAQRDLVWALIGTLSPRARTVLVLRYYELLPDREIAEILGCAESTVRSIALRAFTVLRRHPMLADLAATPTAEMET
jgi:RNA polymerase sigma-70 factor (sigma-E family)